MQPANQGAAGRGKAPLRADVSPDRCEEGDEEAGLKDEVEELYLGAGVAPLNHVQWSDRIRPLVDRVVDRIALQGPRATLLSDHPPKWELGMQQLVDGVERRPMSANIVKDCDAA